MRSLIVAAALMSGSMVLSSNVFGQECLRPAWGKCVSLPNGGTHTGESIQREKLKLDVPPGPDICVSNEEEIGGYTFARFQRNGAAWPNEDWAVNVDDFCFYKK
jgi:hypothetical protein